MSLTYNKILGSMKDEFFKLTGILPDDAGDLGVRLKVLAGELFSLSCYGDFILKQAFPQTATGEYLDMQGNQRGVFRKSSSGANGKLTFSLAEPLTSDVEIPVGTICSNEFNPKLSYATTEKGIIKAGELSVDVNANSIGKGEEYNADVNTITVMVTPPTFVNSVTNTVEFAGGDNCENDENLRQRLLETFSDFPNGFNRSSYIQRVETLNFVVDANVMGMWDYDNGNAIKVIVRTRDDLLSERQIIEVQNVLKEKIIAGFDVDVQAATPSNINFTVNVVAQKGTDIFSVKIQVEKIIKDYFSKRKIGESISLIKLSRLISAVDGIESFDFDNYDDRLFITTTDSEYINLDDLEVNVNV